jgi:hypothetical protein
MPRRFRSGFGSLSRRFRAARCPPWLQAGLSTSALATVRVPRPEEPSDHQRRTQGEAGRFAGFLVDLIRSGCRGAGREGTRGMRQTRTWPERSSGIDARYTRPACTRYSGGLHLAGQAEIMAAPGSVRLDETKLGGARDRNCLRTPNSKHSFTSKTLRRNTSLLAWRGDYPLHMSRKLVQEHYC